MFHSAEKSWIWVPVAFSCHMRSRSRRCYDLKSWGPFHRGTRRMSTKHFQSCYSLQSLIISFFNSTETISSPLPHLQIPRAWMPAQMKAWGLTGGWPTSEVFWPSSVLSLIKLNCLWLTWLLDQLLGGVLALQINLSWLWQPDSWPFGSWTIFFLYLALVFGPPFLCFG